MPTKNPRINITIEKDIARLLTRVARKKGISVSSLAKELLLEALDLQEDMVFSAIADARLARNEKRIKHSDAWK